MKAGRRGLAPIIASVSISLLAGLALAGTAEARGQAATNVFGYSFVELPSGGVSATGGTKSPKASCVGNRKFKLVTVSNKGKTTVVDSGRSSDDGALSGYVSEQDAKHTESAKFVVAKTKGCAKGSATVNPVMVLPRASAKATKSDVVIAGLGSFKSDGTFAGVVNSSKAACRTSRKLTLTGGGTVLDKGTTTKDGTWGLHITEGEFFGSGTLKVKASPSRLSNGGRCAGSTATFEPAMKPRRAW